MRRLVIGGLLLILPVTVVAEEQKRSTKDQLIGGVVSGLLGQPQPSPDAAYLAQERDRLVSMLQSGGYATTRQGEPVDVVAAGIPLTRTEHVYTAKPVPPSQAVPR